jgi:hypothetical protein
VLGMGLKVGDRVIVREIEEKWEHLTGQKAIVVDIDGEYEYPVELEFYDKELDAPELFREHELELVEEDSTLKEQFIEKCKEVSVPKVLTVAVKLPSGAIEVITNTEDTVTKALYYTDTYDEHFRLKHNKAVQIVGFMVV